ncbi:MAG: class IV adenylate cyclase [Pseudomonadota bacterium]
MMEPFEIEVKFFISNPSDMRNRILALGAETKGRFFETNIRYEDAQNSFIQKGSILRLRKDQKTTLTYKSKVPVPNRDFKILRELEVEVSNFQNMQNILEALGFHEEQIYEKWRETLILNGLVFCIDTMPFGIFLEIEGNGAEIIDSAKRLDLIWEQRILANYLSIFERIKTRFDLSFSNITFQNFRHLDASFESVIQSFQEG